MMKLETIVTKRQAQTFMLMAQGYSQREIAEKQNVSVAMVSRALQRVYAKLGASNAVEAIREALLHGLLTVKDMKRKDVDA